jgi:hypothetical protein
VHNDDTAPARRLRVGYIVDEGPQPWLVQQLVERAAGAQNYEPAVLLQVSRPPQRSPLASLARGSLEVLTRMEYVVVSRMTGFHRFFRTVPVDSLGLPVRRASADAVREHGVDVLVHAALAPPADHATVAAARLGLLLPEGGIPARTGAPALHEVRRRDPRTPWAIRHRVDGHGTEKTVISGALNTAPLATRTAIDVTRKLAGFIHIVLERSGRNGAIIARPDPGEAYAVEARPGEVPGLFSQAAWLAATFVHGMERTVRRALGARWRWSVAYQFTDSWKDAALSRSRVIANPPNRFFSDPCVIRWQGRHLCFVEDYDYGTSRARISVIELREDGPEVLGPALEEPFHLSYPFVFEVDGELYMCPETAQAREIRLYRCTGDPCSWIPHAVLMRDVAAVDTSILFQDGRWWMLTNVDSAGIGEFRSELHVFTADRFDSEAWQPHPGNPVVTDSARARNGGLILDGGEVFRVFQVHGFDVYGQSMGVARVTLAEDSYDEEVVRRIAPDFIDGIVAAHTLSCSGGVLALDFVRRERPDR